MAASVIISRIEASTEPRPHVIISRIEAGVSAARPHVIISRIEVGLDTPRPHVVISRIESSTTPDATGQWFRMLQNPDGSWYPAPADIRAYNPDTGTWSSLLDEI